MLVSGRAVAILLRTVKSHPHSIYFLHSIDKIK